MNNIYIKSLAIGALAFAGAYVLNLVISWNDDASMMYWVAIFVAFVVGSFIGLKINENRKNKN